MAAALCADSLAAMLDEVRDEVLVLDPDRACVRHANAAAAAALGQTAEALAGQPVAAIAPELAPESLATAIAPLADGAAREVTVDTTFHRADGGTAPRRLRLRWLPSEAPPAVAAIAGEPPARAAGTSEGRLRAILDTAVDGIVTVGADGTILSFNKAAERMFLYRAAEVIGRNVAVLMPSHHAREHDAYIQRYLTQGITNFIGRTREIEGQRRHGSRFPMEISVGETRSGGDLTFTGIMRDITGRKADETTLLQAEKMASLGSLVAGVAHEINTPIGVAVTAATHLREATQTLDSRYRTQRMKRADLERFLETTQQSAAILETNLRQASELIRGFKQVAVDQSGEQRRTVALRAYLNEVLLSLRPKLKGTRVEVELDVPEDLSTTTNVGALSQIVTNLVINSLVHGFPDGQAGTIQIQARAREREVALDYRDDGAGMDAATAHRVFEPFFTTRRGRGGSGLGMHILYNLVTGSLGGRVTCRGAPGEGVHVAISFPQHGAEGAA